MNAPLTTLWQVQAERDRLRKILAYAVESTDDSCQCGFYEECASEGNPNGWGVCWKCAAEKALAN